jgi:hypothetical protein
MTTPLDPKYSDGSGSSAESKAEEFAKNVAFSLVGETYNTIAALMDYKWTNPCYQLELSRQFVPNFTLLISSAYEAMEVRLGRAQIVKAINDGGMVMKFRRDPRSSSRSSPHADNRPL